MDHLARRDRSLKELSAYLGKKGYPEAEMTAALRRMVELRYLDEERLARAIIRDSRLASRGPRAAWLKLRQRGVQGWTLERVVEEWRAGQDSAFAPPVAEKEPGSEGDAEKAMALAFVQRRYPDFATDRKQAQRALGALLRRGFSYETALSVLK